MISRRRLLALPILVALGCGGNGAQDSAGRPHGAGAGPWAGGSGREGSSAVPVEVAHVVRRSISSFIETNGTLEAENEVDLVARVSAPIVELLVEEGLAVRKGQVLARLDREELQAQLEISRVSVNDATLVYERAKKLYRDQLISEEQYQQVQSSFEAASAQLEANRVQFGFSTIRAPFDGLIVTRYVDFAQQVSVNTPLFRISDFDPLLCPIRVPERELSLLHLQQPAHLTVAAWPDQRFEARVLLISPVVDAATGTIKVTLKVRSEGRLRPGMFARVFLQTATRDDALVIPRSALSLESIGDTVYVAADGLASRREVTLGFREGDFVQALSGVMEREAVIVVGQDGLSDGTPIQILGSEVQRQPARTAEVPRGEPQHRGARGRAMDFSTMSPEQRERIKERMRERGMTEEQIEARFRSSQ